MPSGRRRRGGGRRAGGRLIPDAAVASADPIPRPAEEAPRRTIRFDVLTLFPDLFAGYLTQSLLKIARNAGIVDVRNRVHLPTVG